MPPKQQCSHCGILPGALFRRGPMRVTAGSREVATAASCCRFDALMAVRHWFLYGYREGWCCFAILTVVFETHCFQCVLHPVVICSNALPLFLPLHGAIVKMPFLLYLDFAIRLRSCASGLLGECVWCMFFLDINCSPDRSRGF